MNEAQIKAPHCGADTNVRSSCGYKLNSGYFFCKNRVRFIATARHSGKALQRCGQHMHGVTAGQYDIVDLQSSSKGGQ